MRFFLVHELSCSNGAGRLRARACRPMTQVQAEILADTLDAIDGVEGVRVNPRVPSVLVLYRHAQARQAVLRSLAAQAFLRQDRAGGTEKVHGYALEHLCILCAIREY